MHTVSVKIAFGLIPGATLSEPGQPLILTGKTFTQQLEGVSPGCEAGLLRMAASAIDADDLAGTVSAIDGFGGLIGLERLKYQLGTLGALCRTVSVDGIALATLHPMASGPAFAEGAAKSAPSYALSRFAYLHRVDDTLELHCPLGRSRILCHDARAAALIAALAAGGTVAELAAQTHLPEAAVRAMLDMMLHAQAAHRVGNAPAAENDLVQPIGGWEFHDLLFHMRTRLGRHDQPVGGTFHMEGQVPPPPVQEPRPWAHDIALPVPDLVAAGQTDPAFASVVERRRSTRDYGETPIDVATLGAFLYRTARVQQVIRTGEGDMDLSLRPYPGGGAIHELEIYPVVGDCAGLARGIYHYDAFGHRLGLVTPNDRRVEELLHIAWQTADRKSPPQIFFVIAARFRRLQWKYQSVAYAVILKNVGVLYEAMYLTATAMDLAPCSLGGGTIDLFCTAAGLDPYAESPVGEFMLGSRAST